MQRTRSFRFAILFCSLAMTSPYVTAEQIIATIPVVYDPNTVAVDTATNKIYVGSELGYMLTVVDGATLSTTTVNVEGGPNALAVNEATNKIYVTNTNFGGQGDVTVIDGATLSTSTVLAGGAPTAVAVNAATNKIYVANVGSSNVTMIDGATNSTATIPVGFEPLAVAVNPVTNKIYVACNCADNYCNPYTGSVTVIDGVTNTTTSVAVGVFPNAVAIDPATNKIYVSNGGSDQGNTVTVIDGATLSTSTVVVGTYPVSVAVNSVTNKIYVANRGNGFNSDVTVIDGATNSTTTIAIPDNTVAQAVDVDPLTNKIYVADCCTYGLVTVIDGATNSTMSFAVGNSPSAVAVDPRINRVYVPNGGDDTLSVIGTNPIPVRFVPVTPCRVVDTRNPYSGGPIQGGTSQDFYVWDHGCILKTGAAYSLNITVVPHEPLGYLTVWPTGLPQPLVSTLNSLDGRIKANAAIVPAGPRNLGISIYATNTTDVILDINGYFTPAGQGALAFYPLTPCRVLDTRKANGNLGGPFLTGGQERDFPVLASSCIPQGVTPQAYSMNFTVVPVQGLPLGYLTVWPQGQSKPLVSTLNNLTATIVANAAIVPAGTGGGIATYPDQNTQLVADIDGYFAPPGQGGLSLYPVTPCRVIDTRKGNGAFSGELTVDVLDSACAPPATAQAYVFNATVVPSGGLGYLTLWPDGPSQPVVSTLNAIDGAITSNMAIVPTTNGKVDAYASGITQLILDISSYFAP